MYNNHCQTNVKNKQKLKQHHRQMKKLNVFFNIVGIKVAILVIKILD